MKKTISFVGSVGIPAKYGGFETLTEQISIRLSKMHKIVVFCSAKQYPKAERKEFSPGITRYFLPLRANGVQSVLYDLISLLIAIKKSDTIFVFGGGVALFFPFLKPFLKNKKLIFHPDGIEWKRKKWNLLLKVYLKIAINLGLRCADKIIIDNSALLVNYNRYRHKHFLCSYGGDHVTFDKNKKSENYWLTIARAEPENNLEIIAETFSKEKTNKWMLISNHNDTKFGRKLYKKFKENQNIIFLSSIYSKDELSQYYSSCKGYIHAHSAGGTNPTLTTAMWLGKPLICHKNRFNIQTTKGKALFFNNDIDLAICIKDSSTRSKELAQDALKIANHEYTWDKIAEKYNNLIIS